MGTQNNQTVEGGAVRYQLKVFGKYEPETYHFTDPRDLAEFLLSQESILEVAVREV